MAAIFTYLAQYKDAGKDTPGAQDHAEFLLRDAFERDDRVNEFGKHVRSKTTRAGYWKTCERYDSGPIPAQALSSLIDYLATSRSSVLREYGPRLAKEYPDDLVFAWKLASVGEMSMRPMLHKELRSPEFHQRMSTAKAMVEGGALNDEDLAVLRYMAESDPEPKVRNYLTAELPKLSAGH
jgi:hypothetical protein